MFFPWKETHETSPGSSWERVRPPTTPGTHSVPSRSDRFLYQDHVLGQFPLLKRPFAPVHELLSGEVTPRILDVGSGTGSWGRDIAKKYPLAHCVGIDREETTRRPTSQLNYQFVSGDVLHSLPFPDAQFHYVHQRLLAARIPFAHWPLHMRELARVTAPGGWIELVEAEAQFHFLGPATRQMREWCHHLATSQGVHLACLKDLGHLLQQSGLRHVRAEAVRLPVGQWAGREGDLLEKSLLAICASLRPWLTAYVPDKQFDAVVSALPCEWSTFHTHYEMCLFAAQRPALDSDGDGKEALYV